MTDYELNQNVEEGFIYLFGVKMPYEDYKKYHDGDYTARVLSYPYKYSKITLYDLEKANNSVLAKGFLTERYEREMRDEYLKLKKEIIEKYGNENKESEGYKAMKHNRFDGYMNDLQNIYDEVAKERQSIAEKLQKNELEWKNTQ